MVQMIAQFYRRHTGINVIQSCIIYKFGFKSNQKIHQQKWFIFGHFPVY